MPEPKPDGYIELTLRLVQEGEHWTAECVELGTATFADSLAGAFEAVDELVTLHLNALEDVGECRAFLREHGITLHKHQPKRPSPRRQVAVRSGEFIGVLTEPVRLAAAS